MEVLFLSRKEKELIFDILEGYLSDLHKQIESTDNRKDKRDLNKRMQEIVNLSRKVQVNKADPAYKLE